LFSKDGTIGLCCLVEEDKDFIISSGIVRITPTDAVLTDYLLTLLSLNSFANLAERQTIGAVIPHLRIEELLKLRIPLPSLEIQQKIAGEVTERRQKAKRLKREAQEVLEKAKREVEAMILG